MDLQLKDQLFVICGATSGFGKAVSEALLSEGARIIAVARGYGKLQELQAKSPQSVETVACDITQPGAPGQIADVVGNRQLHGILVNAGGPPARTVLETSMEEWDNAYQNVLRWKISLTQTLIHKMIEQKYGRIVYIESATVKQPMENLVLSNSMRLAVVGYVKTLHQEVAMHGVTLNVLAPGYHLTPAMNRLFDKKMEQAGSTRDEVMKEYISQTSVRSIGSAEDFASLAVWLFSPASRYISGQVISVDGGLIKGTMG